MNDSRRYAISTNSKVRTFSLNIFSRIMLNAANFPFTSGLIFVRCIGFPMWIELDANIRSVQTTHQFSNTEAALSQCLHFLMTPPPPFPPARLPGCMSSEWQHGACGAAQGSRVIQSNIIARAAALVKASFVDTTSHICTVWMFDLPAAGVTTQGRLNKFWLWPERISCGSQSKQSAFMLNTSRVSESWSLSGC